MGLRHRPKGLVVRHGLGAKRGRECVCITLPASVHSYATGRDYAESLPRHAEGTKTAKIATVPAAVHVWSRDP
jgi:hypothetical protein